MAQTPARKRGTGRQRRRGDGGEGAGKAGRTEARPTSVRTTVVLPAPTAAALRQQVPARRRSEFVAEAVQRRLRELAFERERQRSFGIWGDSGYPHLRTAEDMEGYLQALRDDRAWRAPAGAGEAE